MRTISDASSGFRCVSNDSLTEFAKNYMDSCEALIVGGQSGFAVGEIIKSTSSWNHEQ